MPGARQLQLLAYDIADPRRLRRVARLCERYGLRVQASVFLVELDQAQAVRLAAEMARLVHPQEDSVRYIPVCPRDLARSRGLGLCSGLRQAPSHWVV